MTADKAQALDMAAKLLSSLGVSLYLRAQKGLWVCTLMREYSKSVIVGYEGKGTTMLDAVDKAMENYHADHGGC